ncbi:MAG: CRTAC1 family protein [Acidobacteriota bacterium]
MVTRLEKLRGEIPPVPGTFRNHLRLELLRADPEPENPKARLDAQITLATEELRSGDSEAAGRRFAAILETLTAQSGQTGKLEAGLRLQKAIAHLRAGEQRNCLEGHGSESCLMPIAGGGVHHDPRGSEQALDELATLLRDDPDDLMTRWLYNIAAMTLGRYPDQVPEAWLIPPSVFVSQDDIGRFPNRAPALGLDTVSLAGGVVADDLDGDGQLDVMVSSWGYDDPLRLFLSGTTPSGLKFTESPEAGLEGLNGGLNLVHADYDNDGDADILVLRGAWRGDYGRLPNSLLRNDGHGRFEDVTEAAGLLSFHPTQTAAFADFDNDGWLDLFIGNESSRIEPHRCQLYRNLGAGPDGEVTFTDIAPEMGVDIRAMVKGVAWGDVDNDGRSDLFLSMMGSENLLFRNPPPNEAGELSPFEDITRRAGVQDPRFSFPTWFFDFDNDGWLDLFVGAFASTFVGAGATTVVEGYLGSPGGEYSPRLFRNRGDGTFTDISEEVGLDRSMLIMGANFGDLDNDGWLDIYLGTGAPSFSTLVPNRLFRNDGGTALVEITTSAGVGHLQKGHGVAFADIDADGDQDILAVMGGAFSGDVYQNAVFMNPGHANRFLTVRLEGTRSNKAAIGARLRFDLATAESSRRSLYRTVSSGGSFGASSLQVEVGLGQARAVPRLEIRWPGSDIEVFRDLPLDAVVEIRQGDGVWRRRDAAEGPSP